MLTLDNFELQISKEILKRGQQYFKKDAVLNLEEVTEDHWQAEVEGSTDNYVVEVELSEKILSAWTCDCPYEGTICKHCVAVFYKLKEQAGATKKKTTSKKAKKLTIEGLLSKIEVKELRQFVVQYAAKNKEFATNFQLHFADKDDRIDVAQKFTTLLKQLIRSSSDGGFVDYRATFKLSKEVNKILATGEQFLQQKNYKDAMAVGKVVLTEMMNVIMACDDSAGNIGETLFNAIELFSRIATAQDVSRELVVKLLEFLLAEMKDSKYFDYGDVGFAMLDVAQSASLAVGEPDMLLAFIDQSTPALTDTYKEFRREYFITLKIEFLQDIGRNKEADEVIEDNLTMKGVRQIVVQEAIDNKEYERAKQLIQDGIKIAEQKGHPGTVSQWTEVLLQIAVLENDIPVVRSYTKHFAFDRGFSRDYYRQWKATFSKEEWSKEIEGYLQHTIAQVKSEGAGKMWGGTVSQVLLRVVGPMYIEEGFWDRLFALVQESPSLNTLLEYHKYLVPHYPAQMQELYLSALEKFGEVANGRGEYARLAEIMRNVKKELPDSEVSINALALALKEKFPRRPAMLEELNNVLAQKG